jgi:hypothetical protein
MMVFARSIIPARIIAEVLAVVLATTIGLEFARGSHG